jgi:hypothetical protein
MRQRAVSRLTSTSPIFQPGLFAGDGRVARGFALWSVRSVSAQPLGDRDCQDPSSLVGLGSIATRQVCAHGLRAQTYRHIGEVGYLIGCESAPASTSVVCWVIESHVAEMEHLANKRPATFRAALDFQRFRKLEGIVELDAKVANGAFELRVSEKQLAGAKVACFPIEHGDLRAAKAMGTVGCRL